MLQFMKQSCPIYDFYDLDLEVFEKGLFRVKIPLSKNVCNHVNIMHASVLYAAAECLGGVLCALHLARPEKFQPVVRTYEIAYKKPAFTAVIAEARFTPEQEAQMNARLEETGKYDFKLASQIHDADGDLVAEGVGDYAVRNFLGA